MKSVLQNWVMELPLMQQAVLISAVRGPDGFNKNDAVKYIVRYFRGIVLNPAREDLVAQGRDDVFMNNLLGNYHSTEPDTPYFMIMCQAFLTNIDPYPLRFVLHLAHAAEIIGYKYPVRPSGIAMCWFWLYEEICKSFHMKPEDENQLDTRLNF